MLFKGSKNYKGMKKACLKYSENIKMQDDTSTSTFRQRNKFDKDPKGSNNDELCKQVENHHLMMMKRSWQTTKQAETVCYKCDKKGPLRVAE